MSRGRKLKKITPKEKSFIECMVNTGLGPVEAARKALGWRCEPGTREVGKAVDLARSPRALQYRKEYEARKLKEAEVESILDKTDTTQLEDFRTFAYQRLTEIRDDNRLKSQVRYNAVTALEKLSDPSKDTNLILKWLEILWRGGQAHCPSCHNTFPLAKIKNSKLEEVAKPAIKVIHDPYDRRIEILKIAEKRKIPHLSQKIALSAMERDIVGLGPARAGKSQLLAWMAYLTFLIPGVEIWILAEAYERARKEVEYLRNCLNAAFYPYYHHFIKEYFDTKTGELTLKARWGSELKVRSAKAKGSITGSELEMALVAEPGWIADNVFEELRARMVSRLGRIVMLGTPKGYGGILGRMINMTGRDPKTKKILRISPQERTLEAGSSWNTSLRLYNLKPEDNPEYVTSELDAARMQLMDAEYASEFEGLMASAENSLFPQVRPEHLRRIPREKYGECVWILAVDQGPKNFAYVLLAWDGDSAHIAYEAFESDERTIKTTLLDVKQQVPFIIRKLGGNPDLWNLTIFDDAPSITNELHEMDMEGQKWPTEITWKHKNLRVTGLQENWRKETYAYINNLAMQHRLWFDMENCHLLHDQVLRALERPDDPTMDLTKVNRKGWIIYDPWRGDHVVDAFSFAMWTLLSSQVIIPKDLPTAMDPYAEARAGFQYSLARQERKELSGFRGRFTVEDDDDLFERTFGRKKGGSKQVLPPPLSPYKDY